MCEDCVIAQLGGDSDNRKSMNHKLTDFELEHNANTSRPTPPGVIRCPVCSQETHIGNDIMFVNLMLLDYVRIREIGLNGRGDERICRACKSEEAAVANCLHCCSDLCNKFVPFQAMENIKFLSDAFKLTMTCACSTGIRWKNK
uniref:Protein E6 n=1 Tax=Globodera pallida TaxID=36090 RepID=A0A183C3Q2_GLOPA